MKKIIKISLIFLIFLMILLYCKSLSATGVVTGKSVRLRKEATTESEILTTLKKDEQVEIIGEIEGWYNINFKDKTGYVSKDYVKILEEDEKSHHVKLSIKDLDYRITRSKKTKIKETSLGFKTLNSQLNKWINAKEKELFQKK